jgi:hypothetical protein
MAINQLAYGLCGHTPTEDFTPPLVKFHGSSQVQAEWLRLFDFRRPAKPPTLRPWNPRQKLALALVIGRRLRVALPSETHSFLPGAYSKIVSLGDLESASKTIARR